MNNGQTTPEKIFDAPADAATSAAPTKQTASLRGAAKTALVIPAVCLVAGLAGGYIVGKQTSTNDSTAVRANGSGPFGVGANGMGSDGGSGELGVGQGGGTRSFGTMGTVTAVSSSSITVQDGRQNSAQTYSISSSTTVKNNGLSASVDDIKTGDRVLLRTDASSGSSTSITSIELNPTMPTGQGGMQGGPSMGRSDQNI